MPTKVSGWYHGTYKGRVGTIIGRQPPLPSVGQEAMLLLSFAKPSQDKGQSDEDYAKILEDYVETFGLNPEQLGPCVCRMIKESEVIINE